MTDFGCWTLSMFVLGTFKYCKWVHLTTVFITKTPPSVIIVCTSNLQKRHKYHSVQWITAFHCCIMVLQYLRYCFMGYIVNVLLKLLQVKITHIKELYVKLSMKWCIVGKVWLYTTTEDVFYIVLWTNKFQPLAPILKISYN